MEPTANKILIKKYITGKPDALCVELAALQSAFVHPAFSSQHKQLTILRDEIKSLPAYNENASWNVDHFKTILTAVRALNDKIADFAQQVEDLKSNQGLLPAKNIETAKAHCQKCIIILLEYEAMLDKIVAKLEKASAGSEEKLLVEMAIEALRADAPPVPVTPSQAVQEPIIAPPPSSTVVAPSAPQQALPADTVQIQAQAPAVISSQAAPVPTVTTSSQAVPEPVPIIAPATPSTVASSAAQQAPARAQADSSKPPLSPEQERALQTLEETWNKFVVEQRKLSESSDDSQQKILLSIFDLLKSLGPKDLIAVLESKREYDALGYRIGNKIREKSFLENLSKSYNPEYFIKVFALIPKEERSRVLEKIFYKVDSFFSWWFNFQENYYSAHSMDAVWYWRLMEYLDEPSTELFFNSIAKHMNASNLIRKCLQTAPHYDEFCRLFSVYVQHNKSVDSLDGILVIFELQKSQIKEYIEICIPRERRGKSVNVSSVVKRFLQLTNISQREEFIKKLNPNFQQGFREALTEYPRLLEQVRAELTPANTTAPNSDSVVGVTGEKPDTNPPKGSTPGAGASPTSSNTIYWVMGAVLSAAIILSVLFANLLIAGCVAGGGLLTIGALWFFKTRNHGAEKVTPSSMALGNPSQVPDNGSGIGEKPAVVFTPKGESTEIGDPPYAGTNPTFKQ